MIHSLVVIHLLKICIDEINFYVVFFIYIYVLYYIYVFLTIN